MTVLLVAHYNCGQSISHHARTATELSDIEWKSSHCSVCNSLLFSILAIIAKNTLRCLLGGLRLGCVLNCNTREETTPVLPTVQGREPSRFTKISSSGSVQSVAIVACRSLHQCPTCVCWPLYSSSAPSFVRNLPK